MTSMVDIHQPQSGPLLRRMRHTAHLREFIAETHISVHDLCHPLFIKEGINQPVEVENLPGVFYYPVDLAIDEIKAMRDLGVKHFVVRPRPDKSIAHDAEATMSFEGRVIEAISNACPDVTKIIDGYFGMARPSGYYGVVRNDGSVDLEATQRELAQRAIIQGSAGADVVVSLGRVDNAVATMRAALDANQLEHVAILAYAVNFASSLAHAMLDGTDMAQNANRQTVASKIGVGNMNEALRQTELEVSQGADFLGVKPATIFLDAVAELKRRFRLPVATYFVSKEYCMVKAAAQRGWINERDTVLEYVLSAKRAGADKIFSYWTKDLIKWTSQ